MVREQIDGATGSVAAVRQQAVRAAIGEPEIRPVARARRAYQEASVAWVNGRNSIGDTVIMIRDQVRETPLLALVVAGGFGWLIGRALR